MSLDAHRSESENEIGKKTTTAKAIAKKINV